MASCAKVGDEPATACAIEGEIIFGSSRSGDGDLYSVSPCGGPAIFYAGSDAPEGTPRFDQTRGRIVYMRFDDGGADLLSEGALVFRAPNDEAPPDWSPAGDAIVTLDGRGADARLVIADPDGANPRSPTGAPAGVNYPAFSPDGRLIAFIHDPDGAGDRIGVYDLASGETRSVTAPMDYAGHPAWSPDGDRIAFDRFYDGDAEIAIVDLADGQIRRVTDRPGNDLSPDWSFDGQFLVFAAEWRKSGVMGDTKTNVYKLKSLHNNLKTPHRRNFCAIEIVLKAAFW